jgi:hypothetical protein
MFSWSTFNWQLIMDTQARNHKEMGVFRHLLIELTQIGEYEARRESHSLRTWILLTVFE